MPLSTTDLKREILRRDLLIRRLEAALDAAELVIAAYEDRDWHEIDDEPQDYEALIEERRSEWGAARSALAELSQ